MAATKPITDPDLYSEASMARVCTCGHESGDHGILRTRRCHMRVKDSERPCPCTAFTEKAGSK